MKRIITIILFVLVPVLGLMAQLDPVAKSVLDKFSEKALKANSVHLKFTMLVEDAVEESETSSEGEIIIQKNTYKLSLPDNIIWFDGKAIYTLVPDVEEVTITEPDPNDVAFLSQPSLLFTMYKEGYKIRMIEERPGSSVIDLYPEDLTIEFSRVRLTISKDYTLESIDYKRKDGITISLAVSEYNLKKTYKESFFQFNAKEYLNVDIIDMRF